MEFLTLAPFIPSGNSFQKSKELFLALGFQLGWEAGGYAGFQSGGCNFILQDYDNIEFAQNLMLNIKVSDVRAFRQSVVDKNLVETFGIQLGQVVQQPYGLEVNIIDIAGVCWHFVE